MEPFDIKVAAEKAIRLPWYNFLAPRPLPPFKEKTSLDDANQHAAVYSKEIRNLQMGRAIWAWIAIAFAILAAVGWLNYIYTI